MLPIFFFQWLVAEQVEEEADIGEVVERVKIIAKDPIKMFVMDFELAKRVSIYLPE